jgi:phasin family protein
MKDVPMNSLQADVFPYAYTDLTKAWVNFEFPFLPLSALREVHRKNAAALTSASQVVVDCLQALAQRQAQFIKSTIDDYSKVTSGVLTSKSFEERVKNQADTSWHVVGHLRELSDIAVKANVTAIDILNGRITEAFDELKSVFAEPLALNLAAPTDIIGEHIVMVEHPASVGDALGQDKPEPTAKLRSRKKATPAAKPVRRRASRR